MRIKQISNFQFQISNFRYGFTLIEVLITIAVIGILVGAIIVLVDPLTQLQKANDARRKSDLSQIQKALEIYYQDVGRYPLNSLPPPPPGYEIINLEGNAVNWGDPWLPYMGNVPKDPSSSKKYVYYSSNGQKYYLYANLDRGDFDPQACNDGNACSSVVSNGIPAASCGGTCNYGVSSTNVSP